MGFQNTVKFEATVTDFEGEVCRTSVWYPIHSGDTLSDIQNFAETWASNLQAIVNGRVTRLSLTIEEILDLHLPDKQVNEPYQNAEDKLYVVMRAGDGGGLYTQEIPTPKVGNFLTDGETANPAAAAFADYLGFMIELFSTAAGKLPLVYIRGYFRRQRTRRTQRPGIPTEMGG